MDEYEKEDNRVTEVHLSGLVVLKLIKHCKENVPDLVTGSFFSQNRRKREDHENLFPSPKKDREYSFS